MKDEEKKAQGSKQYYGGGSSDWKKQQEQQTPQMVRTSRAIDNNLVSKPTQLSIFDALEEGNKPRNITVEQAQLQVGLNLDSGGWELILALQLLLHQHSQNTTDQSREDYYRGELTDKGRLAVTTWDGATAPAAHIKTTMAELTKARIGNDRKLSQKDLKQTEELLEQYAAVFPIQYTEYYTDPTIKGKNKKQKRYLKTTDRLYKYAILKDEGTKSDIVNIGLMKPFFHQIATNYNSHPIDYIPRIKQAYTEVAGKKIAKVPDNLYNFLNRLIDAQNYEGCIYHCKLMGEDGLYMMISPAAVKARQWGKVDALLNLYAEVATKIGLLERWSKEPSKNSGEMIATFKVVEQGHWQ